MSTVAVKIYMMLVVLAALLGFSYKCYSHINALKKEIDLRDVSISRLAEDLGETQKQMLTAQLESERYQAALKEQLHAIELHNQKYKQAQSELEKWRADAKKYENIERHLPPQTIINRSNCEDIKNYFDSIDGFSLDSMQ